MNVSGSHQETQHGLNKHDWLILGALASLLAMAGYLGSRDFDDTGVFWRGETGMLVESDQPELSSPGFKPAAGREVTLSEIGPLSNLVWVRMELDLQASQLPDQPVALYLSGPFSADLYWDGQALGSKGRVGSSKAEEIPGPIDTTFHIPDGWAGPGKHYVALRMSAFHVGYSPSELYHTISLGSFRSDPRRELRYYAWPLLLSSGFVLTGLFFLRMYQETGALRALLSAAIAGFILLQLIAEISRSLIAYEYQWHLFRSVAIWLAALGWGLSWQWAAWSRTRERPHMLAIPATFVVALLASYFAEGFDFKVTSAISILALMPLFVAASRAMRSANDVILMADGVLAVALIATAQLAPENFLDRVVYIFLAVHLTATWFLIYAGEQKADAPVGTIAEPVEFFSVKLAGRQLRIPATDVVYLRADGNYCELVCQDDKRHLHQQRLGQIMRSPPAGFVRIQRSHAVNTRYLESLQAFEGSRYEIRLTTGDTLPVSRYRVAELRELIAAR